MIKHLNNLVLLNNSYNQLIVSDCYHNRGKLNRCYKTYRKRYKRTT